MWLLSENRQVCHVLASVFVRVECRYFNLSADFLLPVFRPSPSASMLSSLYAKLKYIGGWMDGWIYGGKEGGSMRPGVSVAPPCDDLSSTNSSDLYTHTHTHIVEIHYRFISTNMPPTPPHQDIIKVKFIFLSILSLSPFPLSSLSQRALQQP